MSIEALTWALSVPIGGNAKVVLLGLANHAHPDGTEAYPSLDTLAGYAHCDRSTARRNVRKLADDGWISEDGNGPKGQTKYALAMGGGKTPRVASEPERGGIAVPPEPTEPSLSLSQDNACEERTAGGLRLIDEASSERSHAGARARPKPMTYGRLKVPAEIAEMGERLLATFNDATGSKLGGRKRDGGPTGHLKQIVGAVMDREGEASEEDWHRAIRNTATNPPQWIEGRLTLGHVFGAKAADHALANTGAVPIGIAAGAGFNPMTRPGRVDWGAVAETLEAQGL